jgi:hypothetical protein
MRTLVVLGAVVSVSGPLAGHALAAPVGEFSDHQDIGKPALPGNAEFDPSARAYRVTGGGANMWAAEDDFHFVWKRGSGDVAIETALDFVSPTPAPGAAGYVHRKGGVIIRQDLDPDSAYVDALRMGNHQLSLQYRETKGGPTRLIWVNTSRQGAVRLEKIGDYAYLFVPGPDGKLQRAGGSFRLNITAPYYIGLAVCPHDNSTRETMAFRNVRIGRPAPRIMAGATLETIQVANPLEQTALIHGRGINVVGWSKDSRSVYAHKDGNLYRAAAWDSDIVVRTSPDEQPNSATAANAHLAADIPNVLVARSSPDGRSIAYLTSANSVTRGGTTDVVLHVVPVDNGKPQLDRDLVLSEFRGSAKSLTPNSWSPDGKLIAFVAAD